MNLKLSAKDRYEMKSIRKESRLYIYMHIIEKKWNQHQKIGIFRFEKQQKEVY